MNETEFRQEVAKGGYGEPTLKEFQPHHSGGDLHTHEFSALAMVVEGEFTVEYEDGPVTHGAGDHCAVAAGTLHTEKTGDAGAKVLFATK